MRAQFNRIRISILRGYPLAISIAIIPFLAISLVADKRVDAQAIQPAGSEVIERGKFRFFDTKQPVGEESYEISREGGTLVLKTTLKLSADNPVSLAATLVLQSDLIPKKFTISGQMPYGAPADLSVDIQSGIASIRTGREESRTTVPARFFTAASYAPLAVEMMMLRYWLQHQQGSDLRIIPAGNVTIEHRGRDIIEVGGRRVLERYSLDALTWGRQTLWLEKDSLVAVLGIGGDIETTLPAVSEGYESALPFFIKRAAQDAIDQFTRLASQLSPTRKVPLAIVGATLIDGTGSAPVADSVVLISGDRIKTVGTRGHVRIPSDAKLLDARGKYLVPGLWDMHAHFFKAEFGPAYLAAGVTTVRDVGNDIELITTLRDAFRNDLGLGPSVLLAGYIEGKNDQHSFDIQVDTPEEARAAVNHYKEAGFEQIKIRDQVKPEILKAIAGEAHSLGMTLTGHVPRSMNVINAVEAGQDQISHINFVSGVFDLKRGPTGVTVDMEGSRTKAALKVFKEHGTAFDPTLAYMEANMRPRGSSISSFEPGFATLPPQYANHLNQDPGMGGINALPTFLAVVEALHKAGLSVVTGTDVIVPAHSLHRELELFVKAGFTPMEAIQAATIVPARVMKIDRYVGTIEMGKRADMYLLDANPLEAISNIRKGRLVVVRGRVYECTKLWQVAGFKP